MSPSKLQAGSRVRYTQEWLEALGFLASKYKDRTGTIREIKGPHRDIPPPRALIEWDDGKKGLVILQNIERVV